ncbi:hypothetical protein AX16_003341 [Volvariella volvacea WC 439]|nr:hypothetical protein AX16_003341 [Volvariella volvacea WC 439]
MAEDLEEFKRNWTIFTEGSLSQLTDWSNVVAAGGSVQACLAPLTDEQKASKRAIRKHYHSVAYPSSDVDLFLWGLTPAQAEEKIKQIYAAVRDSVTWDVTCVRTKHTVSIHSQYPCRSIQIVLRLYSSPAEILAGFDVDAPCFAYDGTRVWGNPRAIVSMMRQCNTVDMTRRSPSYEVRLTKYASRGFEVYVPSLRRADVDPTIYERSIIRIQGLARLLVLEKLSDTETRNAYLDSRRTLRGRPNPLSYYAYRRTSRKYKNDLKGDNSFGGLEMNDYDVASLHIPYGPGWDARRVDKLVYSTDLGMNSTFNPKNKGRRLHRHVAFFGTMEEVLEDCCEHCPAPIDDDEKALQEEEDKQYIRGRISFIEEDPGRQSMSGSFNPIDVGEWSEQVYIGPVEKFFRAIAAHDIETVKAMLKDGHDLQRRDHVGRTVLHAAIICGAPEIACELIDAGARMTARLVDGRSSLHLAVQHNQLVIVKKLLERSAANKEQAEANKAKSEDGEDAEMNDETDAERPSSEDDWSSEDDGDEDGGSDGDGGKRKKNRKGFVVVPPAQKIEEEIKNSGDIPEDSTEEPDILDLNLADWDFAFTPLTHAVVAGTLPILEELLAAGADPNYEPEKQGSAVFYHPLTASLLCQDPNTAMKIVERLIAAGASSTKVTTQTITVFHQAVIQNNLSVANALLKKDPKAGNVIDYPNYVSFPLSTAAYNRHYALVVLLLSYGAKLNISTQNLAQIIAPQPYQSRLSEGSHYQPLEAALAMQSDVVPLFAALGANVSAPIYESFHGNESSRRTYIDWLNLELSTLNFKIQVADKTPTSAATSTEESRLSTWRGFLKHKMQAWEGGQKRFNKATQEEIRKLKELKAYYQSVKRVLNQHDAKTWDQVFPDKLSAARNVVNQEHYERPILDYDKLTYVHINEYNNKVNDFEKERYEELFEACFTGNNEKIQAMCLPPENSGQNPLKISVQVEHPSNRWDTTGITPLFAAIAGRQWETAKLVLAIVAAQYKPKEGDNRFRTGDIDLDEDDDDDDNGSECSDESDMTVDNKLNFIDIAKRPSTVQCNIHPKDVLDGLRVLSADSKASYQNPLDQAIWTNDFEAFVKIGNLYRVLPQHIEFRDGMLLSILSKDNPEMLDQFIRWTGAGLDLGVVSKSQGQLPLATNDKNKLYLGLYVHGKKRVDLARKNDPSAHGILRVAHPLLWQACSVGAEKIIDYLAGEGPLAAYKFYANSNSTEIASRIRYTKDLEKVLPEWLGWTISSLGESPLSVAVNRNNLKILKLLFAKAPRMFGSALHQKMKFSGYNLISLAVQSNCSIELLNYLLAQSISPVERDLVNGWNIYHICCSKNQPRLLEHLLKTLPRDVSEALLRQQSKHRQNTPLHLAISNGSIRVVELLLAFTKEGLLMRDIGGSTALHIAIRSGFSKIVQLLIDASSVKELHIENSVGETPLGLATLLQLTARVQSINGANTTISGLNSYSWRHNGERYDITKLEAEIPKVQAIIQELIQDGKLRPNTLIYEQMQLFVTHLGIQLLGAKQSKELQGKLKEDQRREEELAMNGQNEQGDQEKREQPEDRPVDTRDVKATFEVVDAAVKARPGLRVLVHLIDVQRSVHGDLEGAHVQRLSMNREWMSNRRRKEILEPEKSDENKEKESMFINVIPVQENLNHYY